MAREKSGGKTTLGQILEGLECPTEKPLGVLEKGRMIQARFENWLQSGSHRRDSFISIDGFVPVTSTDFVKST